MREHMGNGDALAMFVGQAIMWRFEENASCGRTGSVGACIDTKGEIGDGANSDCHGIRAMLRNLYHTVLCYMIER